VVGVSVCDFFFFFHRGESGVVVILLHVINGVVFVSLSVYNTKKN
jgi:hypothetical protein